MTKDYSKNKIYKIYSYLGDKIYIGSAVYEFVSQRMVSPTHKRTEGRAPVWGSEFTSNRRRNTGGDPAETAVG